MPLLRALLVACALFGWSAHAQFSPARGLTFIVPYAPGGGHDASARILAQALGARIGQTVIVDNRAGANGMVGAELASRAAPDGLTLLYASPAETVIAPFITKTMRYDPWKDLVPVTLAGITPLVIVAHPSTGVKTLSELIALARRQPGKLSFGTAGNGSSQHLAGAWLNNLAGIDLLHVPYKGAGPATNDVLGGQIPFAIVGMAPVLPHIRSGKLVAVAVTTRERVGWAKDVPTVAEYPGMKDFEVPHWMGIFAPARTPTEVIHRVRNDIAAALKSPEVADKFVATGVDPVGNTPEQFRDFLAADRTRFATMFRLSGLTPE